jgi:hypothetical protein
MTEDAKLQSQLLEVRTALWSAYAALEGHRSREALAAFTFEDALGEQIERIEGASAARRPNELQRVAKIAADVHAAIALLRAIPARAAPRTDRLTDMQE